MLFRSVTGKQLMELKLKDNLLIALINRNGKIIIPSGTDSLMVGLTGRNDWNSRLVNTDEESFFYPSIGLSGIIFEMVKLPEFISYLKVRGSYTEVGAPVSRSGRCV